MKKKKQQQQLSLNNATYVRKQCNRPATQNNFIQVFYFNQPLLFCIFIIDIKLIFILTRAY